MSYSDWLQERERQLNDWDPIGRLYETGALSGDRQFVELLPIFYMQFGPLLDSRLRSIQLRKESDDWVVRIWRDQHEVRDESVTDLLKGGVDTHPIQEIVQILLKESMRFEVADQLGIFNPPALRLMIANAIEHECAHDRGYNHGSGHWRPLADFGLACAHRLADEVASGIDLVSRTIKNLKSESATGILGDENRSRWDEIVCDLGQRILSCPKALRAMSRARSMRFSVPCHGRSNLRSGCPMSIFATISTIPHGVGGNMGLKVSPCTTSMWSLKM